MDLANQLINKAVLKLHRRADVALVEFRQAVGTDGEGAAWMHYVVARDAAQSAGGSR